MPCNNHALAFDGVDDDVIVDAQDAFSLTSFTVEAWHKLASVPATEGRIFSYAMHGDPGNGYMIAVQSTAQLQFRTYAPDSKNLDGEVVPIGVWTHFAMTYDMGQMSIFQDGVETEQTTEAEYNAFTGSLFFGSSAGNENHQLHGELDEVRVSIGVRYTESFTPVRRLGIEDDTFALWTFDEGEGDLVVDGQSGYEGALVGSVDGTGPVFVDAPCE